MVATYVVGKDSLPALTQRFPLDEVDRVPGLEGTVKEDEGAPGTLLDILDAARVAPGIIRRMDPDRVALEEALIAASRTPARAVGAFDRGAIAAGLRADLVVLDTSLRVAETWVGGVRSPGTVDAPRR